MTDERIDSLFHGLLRHSLVAPGFRATNDVDEDAALEALGDIPVSPAQHSRMFKKIAGEVPCFNAEEDTNCDKAAETSTLNSELAAMFRLGEGETISEELEQRLRELEKEAMEFEPDEDDECGEDLSG